LKENERNGSLSFSREKKIRWFCSQLSVFDNEEDIRREEKDGSGFFSKSESEYRGRIE
jgi:hypothetical protein